MLSVCYSLSVFYSGAKHAAQKKELQERRREKEKEIEDEMDSFIFSDNSKSQKC